MVLYTFKKLEKRVNGLVDKLSCFHSAPPVTKRLLLSKKKSDTLFVLGSGSSICSYTPDMWEQVRSHDSIGFNFWFLHDFVPDYYVAELPMQEERRNLFFRNLSKKKAAYSSCLKMFKSPGFYAYHRELKKLDGRIVLSNWFRARNPEDLARKIQAVSRKRYLLPVIYHQTASVDWILFFSMALGYQEVVLCGVDLNHAEYFYERQREEIEAQGLEIPVNLQVNTHRTNDLVANKGLSLSRIIEIYQDSKPNNFPKLYIALESSALYPQLPTYQWVHG